MRGTVKAIVKDLRSVMIQVDDFTEPVDVGDQVDVERHKEKRSLNANAYFHKLVTLLADKLGNDNDYQKNLLINSYGQYEYIGEQIPTYLIKACYDAQTERRSDIHLKPIGTVFHMENASTGDSTQYTKYAVMRGSHTYNTKEMARLIDGTVSECKAQGIETLTPDELTRMVERWQPKAE